MYGYDGGNAIEVTFEEPVNNSCEALVMLNKPLPVQQWKIQKAATQYIKNFHSREIVVSDYVIEKISTKIGKFVLLSLAEEKLSESYWRSTEPPIHILLRRKGSLWEKVYEDRNWRIEAIGDFDGDGFPEFYVPYDDSSDANIVGIFPANNPLNIEFSSGH